MNYHPPKQADGRDSKEKAIEMINKALHGENQLFDWQHKKCRARFLTLKSA